MSRYIKDKKYNHPRIVLAAVSGGSGKTFISTSLICALKSKNIRVAPFKKGPDFIDPKWLALASGRDCFNLDYHLFKDSIFTSFWKNSRESDIAVIEGNHGFFDSIDSEGMGSTANLARILKAPVILVLNCRKMARSIAPVINGFVNFEKDIQFGGVILNQVSGSRHEEKLRSAIEKYCTIPVLGCVSNTPEVVLEERHLGIITTNDKTDLEETMKNLEKIGKTCLDIDKIMDIARSAIPLEIGEKYHEDIPRGKKVTIAVAKDQAFNFYYPDNLKALEDLGANLVYFSPVNDLQIPPADGIYLGGGYPEIYAKELEKNTNVLHQIKHLIEEGMPVYAECGGMMYLCRHIEYLDRVYSMANVIGADCKMTNKPQGRGYVELALQKASPECLWEIPEGEITHAHEFHFSMLKDFQEKYNFAYDMKRGAGMFERHDGLVYKNLLASYSHLHTHAAKWWAPAFVNAAKRFKEIWPGIHFEQSG
jgi:cobyrinic acid a,c-diamide synthase